MSHFRAAGIPYFHAHTATLFLIFSGNIWHFFLTLCCPWKVLSSLAMQNSEVLLILFDLMLLRLNDHLVTNRGNFWCPSSFTFTSQALPKQENIFKLYNCHEDRHPCVVKFKFELKQLSLGYFYIKETTWLIAKKTSDFRFEIKFHIPGARNFFVKFDSYLPPIYVTLLSYKDISFIRNKCRKSVTEKFALLL